MLLDSRIKGKRIVGYRTYYKELETERKVTLINLFRKDNQVAVNQIVNILLGLTLTTDAVKVPREFNLEQHMSVYDKTYETWVYELTALMYSCQDCGKPTWELAEKIIASLPLDRVYSQNICTCTDNLLVYCSYDSAHFSIYFAAIDPNAPPEVERPFVSDYVGTDTRLRDNVKGFLTGRGDRRDRNESDDMEMDMFDGEKDGKTTGNR